MKTSAMRRGQSAMEFAAIAPVAMLLLAVGVQYAIIGGVDLALGIMNYEGARYAAAHEGCSQSACSGVSTGSQAVEPYMLSVGAAIFSTSSSGLSVSVTPATRSFSQALTVSSTFALPTSVIFLPNPFLGIVWMPASLTSKQTMMSQ